MIPRPLRNLARRLAVGATAVFGCAWWALTYVALTGAAWVAGLTVVVASGLVAGASWLASGE